MDTALMIFSQKIDFDKNKTGKTVLKRLRRQNKARLQKIDKDWQRDRDRLNKFAKDLKKLVGTEKD